MIRFNKHKIAIDEFVKAREKTVETINCKKTECVNLVNMSGRI